MFLQESLPLAWELALKPLNAGTQQVKSKRSKLQADKSDTTAIQLPLVFPTLEQQSYMPGFQVALKSLTSIHKLSFLSLATPMPTSSPTSAQDSTSKEKVFKPYWNGFCQMMSDWFALPTKIGFAALGSILSHGSVLVKSVKYWFSTKRTSVQSVKWLKTSLQLSMSLAADSTDSGSTKKLFVKTVSYRVYPVKALNSIWKSWVGAVRRVYNIAIAYLNENQSFPKLPKSNGKGELGGKMGFKKFLKSSGLIPEWCIELGISKLLDNASQEAYSAWVATAKQSLFIGRGKNRSENPNAGKRIAKFRSVRDQRLTLQFDPTAYKNGRWMTTKTKHLPVPKFEGHEFCVLTEGSTELTYNKGRWFAHFPVECEIEPQHQERMIALDPGIRTFMTGFDGNDFLEFGNGDFSKIAKLCTHLDSLKSKHDLSKGAKFKRLRYKLRQAMERLSTRIKNLRSECHKQVASYLAKNYETIVLPTFETSEMVVKKGRKLRSKTARAMMTWSFYQFSQTLQHLCNRYGSRLVRVTEEYTSKTCTKCGHVHHKLGGSKKFKCPHCGYEIPRDFNGALGIYLKAMWDTTFISEISDDVVILDVLDV